MRTKSALSDARRSDVTGIGVRTGTKFPNEQVRSMIGIVLVTHGRLAAEFRAALEHVAELWQAVQDRLAAGRRERSMAVGAEAPSLLSGLIFDSDGARLSPTHAVKKGKRYRYYVSTALITRR